MAYARIKYNLDDRDSVTLVFDGASDYKRLKREIIVEYNESKLEKRLGEIAKKAGQKFVMGLMKPPYCFLRRERNRCTEMGLNINYRREVEVASSIRREGYYHINDIINALNNPDREEVYIRAGTKKIRDKLIINYDSAKKIFTIGSTGNNIEFREFRTDDIVDALNEINACKSKTVLVKAKSPIDRREKGYIQFIYGTKNGVFHYFLNHIKDLKIFAPNYSGMLLDIDTVDDGSIFIYVVDGKVVKEEDPDEPIPFDVLMPEIEKFYLNLK